MALVTAPARSVQRGVDRVGDALAESVASSVSTVGSSGRSSATSTGSLSTKYRSVIFSLVSDVTIGAGALIVGGGMIFVIFSMSFFTGTEVGLQGTSGPARRRRSLSRRCSGASTSASPDPCRSLRELITVGRTRTVATVKEVYVADVERGRARAITVTDVSGDGEGGPRSQLNSYILLDLVRTEDGWCVDGVTDLAFDIATVLGGEDGPATSLPTSNTAPPPDGG